MPIRKQQLLENFVNYEMMDVGNLHWIGLPIPPPHHGRRANFSMYYRLYN